MCGHGARTRRQADVLAGRSCFHARCQRPWLRRSGNRAARERARGAGVDSGCARGDARDGGQEHDGQKATGKRLTNEGGEETGTTGEAETVRARIA